MLLDISNVSVARGDAPVLRFDDIKIAAGEKLALVGPSGSGKTTLLSVIAGLLQPTTGSVVFDGRDVYSLSPRERDILRGRNFGFVFQTLHLLPSLSLRQNIMLAADMAKMAQDGTRVDSLLKTLGVAGKAHRKPEALSQGEQQRAAIARAVLNRPKILVADEPTSALDDDNAEAVIRLLFAQAEESGAALVVATHDSRIVKQFKKVIRLTPAMKEAA